ncbi:MAG: protein phosphatase 2C domain-containing protein, partial [Clostridia bacterium]|nr:protein phosphatase 2C domain-containing protein [Clostridia bacterium]
MTFAVGTNIARRTYNQDRSLAIQRDNRALFAVADGMGGQGGGTAAELAIENLAELINGDTPFSAGPLRTAIAGANRAIYDAAVITAHLRGMGSTLSALWRNEGTIHIGHIGDSRIYRLHNQYFQQITTDHTFVQELVTTGELTGEEARVHPRRHWLSRALGIEPHARIDIATVPYDEKDIWL